MNTLGVLLPLLPPAYLHSCGCVPIDSQPGCWTFAPTAKIPSESELRKEVRTGAHRLVCCVLRLGLRVLLLSHRLGASTLGQLQRLCVHAHDTATNCTVCASCAVACNEQQQKSQLQVTPDQAVQYEALLAGLGQRDNYCIFEGASLIWTALEAINAPPATTLRLVLDMLFPDKAGRQAAAAIEECVLVRQGWVVLGVAVLLLVCLRVFLSGQVGLVRLHT